MTAEEFDALSFHKGMIAHFLEPKTVNVKIPSKILEAPIDHVVFNTIDGGGGIRYKDSSGDVFIHYSRIVIIK